VKKRILATLVYPAILVIVATLIVSYLVVKVIPEFAKLYADLNVELPGPTKALLLVTVEYRYVFLVIAVFLALAVAGVFLWSRTEKGGEAFDRLKFRVPVVGDTLLKFQVAQFSRTLATLLSGGTPLVTGLQTGAEALGSKLLRGTVLEATQRVREGQSLSHALAARGVMPELALDMIEVGESSGALAPMLNSVAEFYEEEVTLRLGALVAVIEPAILVFMGLLVAFILISLYLPIFSFSMTGAPH
jgi:type IV pilus assembly protein PilC